MLEPMSHVDVPAATCTSPVKRLSISPNSLLRTHVHDTFTRTSSAWRARVGTPHNKLHAHVPTKNHQSYARRAIAAAEPYQDVRKPSSLGTALMTVGVDVVVGRCSVREAIARVNDRAHALHSTV